MALAEDWDAVLLLLEAVLLDGADGVLELADRLMNLLEQLDEEGEDNDSVQEPEEAAGYVRLDRTDPKWTDSKWRECFRFQKCELRHICVAKFDALIICTRCCLWSCCSVQSGVKYGLLCVWVWCIVCRIWEWCTGVVRCVQNMGLYLSTIYTSWGSQYNS